MPTSIRMTASFKSAHLLHHFFLCMRFSLLTDVRNGMSNVVGIGFPLFLTLASLPFQLNNPQALTGGVFPFLMSVGSYIAMGEALYCVFLPLVSKAETGELLTVQSLLGGFAPLWWGLLTAASIKATGETIVISLVLRAIFPSPLNIFMLFFVLLEPLGVLFFSAFFIPLLLARVSVKKLDKITGVLYGVIAFVIPAFADNTVINLALTVDPLHTFFTVQSIVIGQFVPVFSSTEEKVFAIILMLAMLSISGAIVSKWNRKFTDSYSAVDGEFCQLDSAENSRGNRSCENESVIFLIGNDESNRTLFLSRWYHQRQQAGDAAPSALMLTMPYQELTVKQHMKLMAQVDPPLPHEQSSRFPVLLKAMEEELHPYQKVRIDHVSGLVRNVVMMWEIAHLNRAVYFFGPSFSSIAERKDCADLLADICAEQRKEKSMAVVSVNNLNEMQHFPSARFINLDNHGNIQLTGIVSEKFSDKQGKLSEEIFRDRCGKPPVA